MLSVTKIKRDQNSVNYKKLSVIKEHRDAKQREPISSTQPQRLPFKTKVDKANAGYYGKCFWSDTTAPKSLIRYRNEYIQTFFPQVLSILFFFFP